MQISNIRFENDQFLARVAAEEVAALEADAGRLADARQDNLDYIAELEA
jgi:hypothetical protein